MAKKTTTKKKAAAEQAPRRKRSSNRTPEQKIADLKAEIAKIQQRAKAKELKTSPAMKACLNLVSQLDKTAALAKEEQDTKLGHALADAREPLAALLGELGLDLPKARRPRGRKPQSAAQ